MNIRVAVNGAAGVIHVTTPATRHACYIDCTYHYPPGTKVAIRAQPAANVTHFVSWSGSCQGKKLVCAVTLRKDISIGAKFALGG